MSDLELSVVIIARNEEQAIGPCLDSVERATTAFRSEILFVDSASTDRTVDEALRHPIKVVRFNENGMLSPAAGRWLGTDLTRGEYVFFVDGDMIIIEGWIEAGIKALSDKHVGGVSGRLFWVSPGEEPGCARKDELPLGKVPGLGGAALYSRRALAQCGSFNPFLRGEEERELAYRLSVGGFSVMRIDVPMAYHLDKPLSEEENLGRSVYFAGVAQIMRRYPFQRIFWELAVEHIEVYLVWALMLTIGVGLIVLGITGSGRWFFNVAAIVVLGLALLGLWKGPRQLWLYLHSRTLLSMRFMHGLQKGLPSPHRYPCDFAWLKEEPAAPVQDVRRTSQGG